MLGLGINIFKNKTLEPGGFSFSDSDAEAYYNALSTANGGDIDASSLYSITLDALKSAINTLFVDLKADGIFSGLVRLYPFVGATAATHAINAVNATTDLLFVNTPTQDSSGLTLNGTTQYANLNNTPSSELTNYDNHLMADLAITGYDFAFGSRDAILEVDYFYFNSSFWLFDNPDTSVTGGRLSTATENNFNGNVIGTRTSNTHSALYKDGALHGTNNTMVTTDLPENTFFLGAWNNEGTPAQYGNCTIRAASIGASLDATESSDYSTIISTFNTTLGK